MSIKENPTPMEEQDTPVSGETAAETAEEAAPETYTVTREQMAVIIMRYINYLGVLTTDSITALDGTVSFLDYFPKEDIEHVANIFVSGFRLCI